MPIRHTPPTAGTARGQAELGHDTSNACATTTEPTVTWTQIVLSLVQRCWRAFQERRQRYRRRVALESLSERELTDIGMTRAEIEHILALRGIDRLRDGTAHLWMR